MARKSAEKFKTRNDVFDAFTMRNLFVLHSRDYFDEETLSPVSIGKEANVFMAARDDSYVAVKIYRLQTADFNRMFAYIRTDPRFEYLKQRRRDVIFAWAKREYRNLLAAREAGVAAPLPIAFKDNILVMQLIGEPAPRLKDAMPEDAGAFLKAIIENMRRFFHAGYVHGDLSAFNILNDNETPCFIDFSQAQPLKAPTADEMLQRDAKNIAAHFRKMGVETNEQEIVEAVRKKKQPSR